MRIALPTDEEYFSGSANNQLIPMVFSGAGVDVVPMLWNDPSIRWQGFDHVIFCSCWGYHRDIKKFHALLDQLKSFDIPAQNPLEIIRWNSHKKYLLDLEQRGVKIPETLIVNKIDARSLVSILKILRGDTFVIKPCYGAAGFGLMKVGAVPTSQQEEDYKTLLASSDILIQRFINEIYAGEYSAIFLGGELSHIVLKKPKAGEYRSNAEYGGSEQLAVLSSEIPEMVKRTYKLCGVDVLYARVDFVIVSSGIVLMELELIEPWLFFNLKKGAAEKFVAKFQERLQHRPNHSNKIKP